MNAGKINIKAHKDVNSVINKDAINAVPNCLNPLNPVSNFPLLVLTTSIENIDNPKYKGPNNIKGPTNVIAETDYFTENEPSIFIGAPPISIRAPIKYF